MPPELKERLDHEAKLNGRSLNSEIVDRLKKSLEPQGKATKSSYTVNEKIADDYTAGLSDTERQLLISFRRMPLEKQAALLTLFK